MAKNFAHFSVFCAEMEFEERPSDPVLVFCCDKTEPGAFNLPGARRRGTEVCYLYLCNFGYPTWILTVYALQIRNFGIDEKGI